MTAPNQALMRHFGTEDVYAQKLAGMPAFAGRMLMGYANLKRNESNAQETADVHEQAREMNQELAEVRSRLLGPSEEALHHTHAPMVLSSGHSPGMMSGEDVPVGFDEGMVRLAHAIGRDLVYLDLDAMVKSAGIGTALGGAAKSIGKGLGAAGGGIGRGLGLAGMRLGDAAKSVGTGAAQAIAKAPSAAGNFAVGKLQQAGSAVKNTAQNTVQAATNTVKGMADRAQAGAKQTERGITRAGNRLSGKLEAFGQKAEEAGLGQSVAKPASFSQMTPGGKQLAVDARAKRIKGNLAPAAPAALQGNAPQGAYRTPAQSVPPPQPSAAQHAAEQAPPPASIPATPTNTQQALPQQPPVQPAAPPTPAGQLQPPPGGQAPAAPEGGGFDVQKAWDRTGLSNGQWKAKLPLLAGAGLGIYGAVQGAKSLANHLGTESAPYSYNQGGAQPANGINEWGVPQ